MKLGNYQQEAFSLYTSFPDLSCLFIITIKTVQKIFVNIGNVSTTEKNITAIDVDTSKLTAKLEIELEYLKG